MTRYGNKSKKCAKNYTFKWEKCVLLGSFHGISNVTPPTTEEFCLFCRSRRRVFTRLVLPKIAPSLIATGT